MNEIIDKYLDVSDKKEIEEIKKILISKTYSRLEISLRHPYDYRIK